MKVKLGDFIKEYSMRNRFNEDIPVFSVTNTQGFCRDYFGKEVASKDKTTYKIVPKGCFAYNPSRINVGSVDWLRSEERVIVSPLYTVFQVSQALDPQYLFYYLKSDISLHYIRFLTTGSVRDTLKLDALKELQIKYLPIRDQKKVVQSLDSVKLIIECYRKKLEVFDNLIKARFVEMFGDPVSNPKGWPVRPLLEMGNCKNGMNFHYNDSGIEIPCLGVGDFKDHSVINDVASLPMVSLNEMPSEEYLLRDADIVFVRSNGNKALVGRSVAVYPSGIPTTFSGFCIRYRKHDNNITIPYLLRVLKTDSIRAKMFGRGANIQNLNQQILGTLIIPVPPMDLQDRYNALASQIDKSKIVVLE